MSKFKIYNTSFNGLLKIKRSLYKDDRGSFFRIFSSDLMNYFKLDSSNTQINYSLTKIIGTIRGMHYQIPPYAEKKLVTCISGKVYDVAIDLRRSSKTFLQYYHQVLSEDNYDSLIIPEGFAHGFQALEKNSTLIYMHSKPYNQEYEQGISPIDPIVNINWPIKKKVISKRDNSRLFLSKNYDGIQL